jgi:hypothetical protein
MNYRGLNTLRRRITNIRHRGIGATVRIGLRLIAPKFHTFIIEPLFDFKYRTDTTSWPQISDLTIKSTNVERGFGSQPTKVIPLRKFFNSIRSFITSDSVLVDLGCGKGRVLLIASEFGFKEVRGLEYAHELCEIAKMNCSNFKSKTGIRTEYRIIECDVTNYLIKTDENFFYLFNPFDEEILKKVICNIITSLKTKHREIYIILNNPIYNYVIEQFNDFVRIKEINIWYYNKFIVYKNGN